jgi:ELWxxDGT repeat protein
MQANFYGILTSTSPDYTVGDGFVTALYDAAGNQTIDVSETGQLSLLGTQGNNTIKLRGNSSAWEVQRDGSTAVFIKTATGKRVEVPATQEDQTIKFADREAILKIDTTGGTAQVKFGAQTLTTSLGAIAAWGASTATQAPWTLVMNMPFTYNEVAGSYIDGLFMSDGTAAGSVLRTDIGEGFDGYFYRNADKTGVIGYGSTYSAANSWYGSPIVFKTDGTAVGTSVLTETDYTQARYTFQYGDTVIFDNGLATDGTFTTQLVPMGYPSNVLDGGNGVFWHPGQTDPYGSELYRTVITANGITQTMVKDISPGSGNGYENGSNYFLLSDGKVVFRANETATRYSSSSTPSEYWITDGTEAGTVKLASSLGLTGTISYGAQRYVNELAFTATTTANGNELYVTAGGTAVLLDVEVGSGSSSPSIVEEINGKLCFTATTVADGRGFYVANGSSFTRLDNFDYDYQSVLGTVGGQIFLNATKNGNHSIYSTDGTALTHLADVGTNGNSLLAWDSNKAFFHVSDAAHGTELWVADFTANTFGLVKDILGGTGSALPQWNNDYTLVNSKLAFNAYTTATQQGYYLSDGTSAGTIKIGNAAAIDHEVVSDTLIFGTGSGVYSVSTTAATPAVTTLASSGISYSNLQGDSNQVFFQAKNGNLYSSGGNFSTATTLLTNVQQFKVFEEDAIYAIRWTAAEGASLWYSDGTVAGTQFVTDLDVDNPDAYDLWNATAIKTVGHPDWVI